jgi:uncharacterized protein YqjF (DUF2071 family)
MMRTEPPSLPARLALRERPQKGSPVMYQKWRDLLFLHWEYDPAAIQRTLPKGLFVDCFEGKAYLGIVPFFMKDVRPRFCPPVPGISHFMETNVRTYVYDEQGTAGVWFYSLDANQRLAVKLARTFFRLPYFYAWMEAQREGQTVRYSLWRSGSAAETGSRFDYRPKGTVYRAEPDSLEFFLVERYILFSSLGQDGLATGRVYHQPYPISGAEVQAWDDHLLGLDGFEKPGRKPDHILLSAGVEVDIYALERV